MGELSSFGMDRLELVDCLAAAMYDCLVKIVIDDIKGLPDGSRQSGDDSMLKDVWEEFKYQIQREQSYVFDLYEEVIQDICTRRVAGIDRDKKKLLWLWSDGYGKTWVDKDKVSLDDVEEEAIAEELYDRLQAAAENEELAIDPDVERDRERHDEDLGLYGESGEDDPDSNAANGDSTSGPKE
jgi:hypothetical protein